MSKEKLIDLGGRSTSLIRQVEEASRRPGAGAAAFSAGLSGAGGGQLDAVAAPPLDRTVPERLEAEYNAAPELPDRALLEGAQAANRARAERAHEASQRAYSDSHDGRTLMTASRPAFDAVIRGGLTDEDYDDAQHLQRLAVAERIVAAREQEAAKEAARFAARCRVTGCGALDVPTRLPVVELTANRPEAGWEPSAAATVIVLDDGPGVVCADCEAVIVAEYRERLAAKKFSRRQTRRDAARAYLSKVKK